MKPSATSSTSRTTARHPGSGKKAENTKEIVKRGERALSALWLSTLTQADRIRCAQVERAFKAIDREQAAFKEKVDELLEESQYELKESRRLPPTVSAELFDMYVGHLDKLEAIMAPTRIHKEKKDG